MKFVSILLTSILFTASAFASDLTSTPVVKDDLFADGANKFASARPDLSGMRLIALTGGAVYVVNPAGILQWIPDQNTYNRLFRNWDNIVKTDVNVLPIGTSLSYDATLIKGAAADVYLLSNGMKRPVTEAAMEKYNFEWRNIATFPQYIIDSIPSGPLWQ